MNGCIIRNDDILIKDIYNCIENTDNYNWLITNFECYPSNDEIVKILDNEYCWLSGSDLLQLLNKEDFQWIWGVFSAFPNEMELEEVLNYNLPYADGYTGFWKNPISIQHPLAISEIVAWDGSIILVISQNNEIIRSIMKNNLSAQDLEVYNMTQ
ncbi:MAG: hypothetical protein HDT39_11895 [Lachnospiraceae bacterium]|nr:hypothetical protein [Lachnospiraceae bacterium]